VDTPRVEIGFEEGRDAERDQDSKSYLPTYLHIFVGRCMYMHMLMCMYCCIFFAGFVYECAFCLLVILIHHVWLHQLPCMLEDCSAGPSMHYGLMFI